MFFGLDPQQTTIVALLFGLGAAGLKRYWVFGWTYNDKVADFTNQLVAMTADRNFWRDTALKSITHVDQVLEKVKE